MKETSLGYLLSRLQYRLFFKKAIKKDYRIEFWYGSFVNGIVIWLKPLRTKLYTVILCFCSLEKGLLSEALAEVICFLPWTFGRGERGFVETCQLCTVRQLVVGFIRYISFTFSAITGFEMYLYF